VAQVSEGKDAVDVFDLWGRRTVKRFAIGNRGKLSADIARERRVPERAS
jgi:hypothetical protein